MTAPAHPSAETRFTALMNDHGRAVLGYLARRTDPASAAADLMADVFVVVWRRLDEVPSDPPQARAWLIGIARGVLANHRRSTTRRNQLADRLRQHLRSQPVEVPDDTASAVRAALARLGADDRELLTLVTWEELTPSQAAAVLGLSPATTRKRLERARVRLRTILESERPIRSAASRA